MHKHTHQHISASISLKEKIFFTAVFVPFALFILRPVIIGQLSSRAKSFTSYSRFDKAVDYYNRALLLDKRRPKIWDRLGYAYTELENTDKADWTVQENIRLNPKSNLARFNAGMWFFNRHDYAQAVTHFDFLREQGPKVQGEGYIAIIPLYRTALSMLEECYRRLGREASLAVIQHLQQRYKTISQEKETQ